VLSGATCVAAGLMLDLHPDTLREYGWIQLVLVLISKFCATACFSTVRTYRPLLRAFPLSPAL